MKKYILKISLFFFILILFFGINYTINFYYIKNNPPVFDAPIIALGDSHINSGINPSLIPNCINIAQPGESLLQSFYKLKKIHQHHSKTLEKIIISFGLHTPSGYNDLKYSHPTNTKEFIERSYALMSLQEMKTLPVDISKYIKVYIQNMLLYPKKKHHEYIGFYKGLPNKLHQSEVKNSIQKHFYKDEQHLYKISETSIRFLDSITYYCHQNDIEVIWINTPVHQEYIKNVPSLFKEKYEEIKIHLKQKNITVLDFHNTHLDDKYYSDYNHLNALGAHRLTQWIVDKLNIIHNKN